MRTLVVGAAIVDLMMKVERLPKNMICVCRWEAVHLQILSVEA